MDRIIVGVSGASGIILALRTIVAVIEAGFEVDLVLSKAALLTAKEELGPSFARAGGFIEVLPHMAQERVTIHPINNFAASIASGSYKTQGMIIVPCSMATLAAVALGMSDNLLRRAADVILKERRKLVLVPRETPLSAIHLQHMLSLTQMGAVIVPPVPAWYTMPKTLEDVEKFIVGKALDAFGINNSLYPGWCGTTSIKLCDV